MKTLKFVTATVIVIGAGVIVGLYLATISGGTAGKAVTSYRACEPLYCQDLPTATTTVIAEEK